MNKLLFCINLAILFLFSSHIMQAAEIGIANARQIAFDFLFDQHGVTSSKQKCTSVHLQQLDLVYTNRSCYVFSNGKGFAVVSKEDISNAILGYSKNSSFNVDAMPYELKMWLESLSVLKHTSVKHNAIQPMITTKWDQMEPYNTLLSDEKYPTGCVATAMAQLMAYHKWPDTLEKDVNELPAVTFNWGLMRDKYYSDDNDESAQEVAKLMKYCGAAVCMNYKWGESKAFFHSISDALKYFFGYSKSVHDIYRNSYTTEEWDSLIYNELANGRPVIYSAKANNGHAMICDGYDGNGYFHINWGWSGDNDGYYLLPSLNGYSLDQAAIVGIEKAKTPYEYEHCLSYGIIGEWGYHSIEKRNANGQLGVGFKIAWSDYASGWGWSNNIHEPSGGLYKNHKLIEILPITYTAGISDRPSFIYAVRIGSHVPDGHYQLKMLYRIKGTEDWIEPLRSDGEFFDLYILNDSLIIKQRGEAYTYPMEDEIDITGIAVDGNLQAGAQQKLLLTVTNKGTSMTGKLNVRIKSPEYNAYEGDFGFAINSGETETVELPFKPKYAGEYDIILQTYNWGYKQIGSSSVTISKQSSEIVDINKDSLQKVLSVWSIDGRKGEHRGINIIRYNDGTIQKVVTK